ncbi:MAG: sugar transporter permease [Actinomycetia bacterium]|nr:sugar transporter permease [Actinomycetes bacterium]
MQRAGAAPVQFGVDLVKPVVRGRAPLVGDVDGLFVQFGAPLILVALGMTLVIAAAGIDLSVGSVVAISGALACYLISKQHSVLTAVAVALLVALVLGVANGVLVARIGIQPIIATLILMVAGRGVAQLITGGQIITIHSTSYKLIGGGYWLTLPFSILVVGVVVALTGLLTRKTALGLLLEAVGGNAEASRLVGIRSRRIVAHDHSPSCTGPPAARPATLRLGAGDPGPVPRAVRYGVHQI